MRKRVKIVFTASILLNVLFIGAVGGVIFNRWMDRPWHSIKSELSPQSQHIIARTMQGAFKEARPKMREARQSKRELMRILRAEEFNAEAFETVAREMAELNAEMMENRIAITKDLAAQLPAKERAALARRLTEGFSSGGQRAEKRGQKTLHPFLNSMDAQGPDEVDSKSIGPQKPE